VDQVIAGFKEVVRLGNVGLTGGYVSYAKLMRENGEILGVELIRLNCSPAKPHKPYNNKNKHHTQQPNKLQV
jgi:hypothetical protein